jgi:hypothetical protein
MFGRITEFGASEGGASWVRNNGALLAQTPGALLVRFTGALLGLFREFRETITNREQDPTPAFVTNRTPLDQTFGA